jgi:hypothetical protein
MVRAGLFRQQLRLPHKLLDPKIGAAHPRPAGAMTAHIHVQKVSVLHPNTAIGKLRYLRRQFVHLLQREPGQPDIGSEAPGMLAVGNAASLLVVVRAAVPGVDDHGHAGEGAQCLQALDQVRVQLQPATTATFKFFARKVLTQIAQLKGTPPRNCLLIKISQQ